MRTRRALLLMALTLLATCASPAQTTMSLYCPFTVPASSNWNSYVFSLNENGGWTLGSANGPVPTPAQFKSILGSLAGLTISLSGANNQYFLDNVSFGASVSSTFPNCTTDGWMIQDGGAQPGCNSVLGDPPGSINNSGTLIQFDAPAKYVGDKSAAYGNYLAFDLWEDFVQPQSGYVVLTGVVAASNAVPGNVVPWGDDYSGQLGFPAGTSNLVAISSGRFDSMALKSDGTVATCGWNSYNSLPDRGLTPAQLSATATNIPAGLSNVISIACGGFHFLALKNDGTVVAWGNSNYGQTNVPAGLSNVVAIAGGAYHCLALKSDGTVAAWGGTNLTVEGGGQTTNYAAPPANLSNVVAIAASDVASMALKGDGTVTIWGATNNLGLTNIPPGLSNVTAIAAGYAHALALKQDGTIVAWGLNTYGQTNVPPGLSNVVTIAAGNYFSLAVKKDGTVVGWGDNTFLQTNTPPGLSNVTAIAAGGFHSVALVGSAPPMAKAIMQPVMQGSNGFAVSLPTQSGRVYRLEYKNSLSDPNWIALPLVAGSGSVQMISDNAGVTAQRYYRVRRW